MTRPDRHRIRYGFRCGAILGFGEGVSGVLMVTGNPWAAAAFILFVGVDVATDIFLR